MPNTAADLRSQFILRRTLPLLPLVPLIFFLFFLSACSSVRVGPEAQTAIRRNALELDAVAAYLANSQTEWLAAIVREQAQTIRESVPLGDGVTEPTPMVTSGLLEAGRRDPEVGKALASAVTKREVSSRAAVKAEQETSWFGGLLSWAGLGTLLVGAIYALRAASLLGVPYVGAVADVLTIADNFRKKKLEAADTLVAGSMAGRQALAVVQQALPEELRSSLGAKVVQITGGRATTLEELFKLVSKAYAVDAGMAVEADQHLAEVKSAGMKTEGGVSPTVRAVLRL